MQFLLDPFSELSKHYTNFVFLDANKFKEGFEEAEDLASKRGRPSKYQEDENVDLDCNFVRVSIFDG